MVETTVSLPPLPEKRFVVSCGMVFIDFVATVNAFPKPDEKIRSKTLQACGGGNAGNTLTCAARLGLKARLITKVADDSHGRSILAELQADGVDISYVTVSKDGTSPFTYVIVDNQMKTCTCIYTPGYPAMVPDELPLSRLLSALDEARLVHFDGGHLKTALVVAQQAAQMNIPILVDAERSKLGLKNLLDLASYVICTEKFPEAWTSIALIPHALVSILLELPQLKFVIVTLGEREPTLDVVDIDCLIESLKLGIDKRNILPTCVSSENVMICANGVGNVGARLFLGTAETVPPPELVDTTGAGDAFIGAIIYALCAEMPPEKMLPFAARVAAAGCKAIGARTGLPRRDDPCLIPFLCST